MEHSFRRYAFSAPGNERAHALLALQSAGVGGALLRHAIAEIPDQQIHLRASINSVGFYEKQGFAPLDGELGDAGIRYVPMGLNVNRQKQKVTRWKPVRE